ncbi:MAG TPA: hypothetical protein VGN32_07980, partial [Ktedonobacterales bacterium]|nr:hypothetical protein [Ktedonobacterales bacterium]
MLVNVLGPSRGQEGTGQLLLADRIRNHAMWTGHDQVPWPRTRASRAAHVDLLAALLLVVLCAGAGLLCGPRGLWVPAPDRLA